ncbi:histidine N-acetyltransferase-like [Haliotis asinina]|uniref:histidine N-acetyltransferase-like n=1 Tax=Haliotis asinina TaxID=109174 RepID=UPI003531ADE0
MSNHHIRRATADDYQAVMDIGDVLFGLDYLQQYYHTFIEDPYARSYVYLVGEEIVGFCSPHIIDDGTTFLMRGSRVKDEFRGQGIYGRLLKHVYEDFKDTDTIKRDVMTTNNVNYEQKGGLKNTHTFISKKEILVYGTKLTDADLPMISPDDRPQTFAAADMRSLLDCSESCERLFPDGKMTVAWLPLGLLPANLKYMVPSNSLALQTRATDDTHVSLLTVGSALKCQKGLRYMCDVFGRDATPLRHHIISHLQNASSLTEGFVVFEIILESSLRDIADHIMKDAGIPSLDVPRKAMVLLEKSFG